MQNLPNGGGRQKGQNAPQSVVRDLAWGLFWAVGQTEIAPGCFVRPDEIAPARSPAILTADSAQLTPHRISDTGERVMLSPIGDRAAKPRASRTDEMSPRKSFYCFVFNAQRRGIAVTLTFQDWWTIWSRSGLWGARGATRGSYVLSRRDLNGPYSIDNVFVCLKEEAISAYNRMPEARAKRLGNRHAAGYRHTAATRARMSASHLRRHQCLMS
jgi:integrase